MHQSSKARIFVITPWYVLKVLSLSCTNPSTGTAQDPTNPLSVAPPRYKYQPNPETITHFPAYHSESDAESIEAEDEPDISDEGSDFSDEEDRMPEVKRTEKQTTGYDQSCVNISWRKSQDQGGHTGITQALIAVNQVAVILSQALDKYSHTPSAATLSFQKIGHVTRQKPNSADSSRKQHPRKVFSLWTSKSGSSSTLLAVQVGGISDRAVHVVSKTLVEEIASSGTDAKVEILDTYIPQTYVPSAQPIPQLYLDFPPIRYLATKKSIALSKGASTQSSRGMERYESPNYVTGISAGLLSCLVSASVIALP